MKIFSSQSLRTKVVILISLVTIIFLGAFQSYTFFILQKQLLSELHVVGNSKTIRLARDLELPMWEMDEILIKNILLNEYENEKVHGIYVSGTDNIEVHLDKSNTPEVLDQADKNLIYMSQSIFHDGNKIGNINLYLTTEPLKEKVYEELIDTIVLTGLEIVIIIILLWIMMRRVILLPIESLMKYTKQIADGNYSNLQLKLDKDEIGALGNSINQMKNKIELREKDFEKQTDQLKESQTIAGLGSYILDFPTGIWTSSEILDELFGIDKSYERSVEGWEAIVHPDDSIKMNDYLVNEVISKHQPFDKEYRIVRQNDQSIHWVHGLGKLEFDSNGSPVKMIGTIQDVTKSKEFSSSLLKLSLAVEQSPNSVVITDIDGNIEYVNNMFTRVTGYTKDEALGQNPRILKSGVTPTATYKEMWATLQGGDIWQGELINRRKDNTFYTELATISPVKQDNGEITNYVAIKEDITEKKKAEAYIEKLANFDQLTGLANRYMLDDRVTYLLDMAQRNNEPFTVMFLDLDNFKNINDSLGHTIGDYVLIEMAKRIKKTIREIDVVSRLGGDEFIILFPNTDSNKAMQIATKLIEEISKSSLIEDNELTITPSIGIALYPNDGTDFETLLKNADTAMYRVKSNSRNDFQFFTEDMQLNLARNLQLENALRNALKRNELEVYYQPQTSISNGNIIGAEALLRWNHPELGMVSPAEFIPIAENSGQIIEIGEWVLRTAIQQAKDWMDSGFTPIVIAVNLSAIQFRQKNLLEVITKILQKVQLPNEYLELELTEAVMMHDPESVVNIMNKFHEQGIRMSIDDFGTGYSSLSYLKKFQVYKLKIDKSFIDDIIDDADDRAIVSAIIDMAQNLGLQTIAEGVETAEQLAFLRLHGCHEVQGYYFSKPLPAIEFEEFRRNHIVI